MIFQDKVLYNTEAFLAKVKDISAKLDISPDWLMAVMWSESGINPRAMNLNGGATGLIQFMPATARYLGTSTEALRNMTNVQQLDYVYKYYKPYAGRIKSYIDLYFATFLPVAMGKPKDWVLQAKGLSAYVIARDNPVFDLDKNMELTVGEVEKAMLHRIPEKYHKYLKKKRDGNQRPPCLLLFFSCIIGLIKGT